jgi:hypothetical protein
LGVLPAGLGRADEFPSDGEVEDELRAEDIAAAAAKLAMTETSRGSLREAMETAAKLGSGGISLRRTFSGARTCRRSSRSLGNEKHGRRNARLQRRRRWTRPRHVLGSCRENRWVVRALRTWRRRTREGES